MQGFLNKDQIDNLLTSQSIGRLACTDGEYPHITPINYAYDGTYIWGQTNPGTKLDIMRVNPNVCFEVELITNMRHWQCIVLRGEFEEVWDEPADEGWRMMRRNIFSLESINQVHNHEHGVSEDNLDEHRFKLVMFRIRIHEITGRYQKE